MSQSPEFLTQLMRTALGRGAAEDSDTATPDDAANAHAAAQTPSAPSEADEQTGDPAPEFDDGIVSVVASKVLLAWLRNRYQLLFPFALDLRRLDQAHAELLVHAMVAAAQADGSLDGKERRRIEGSLSLIDAGEVETAFLEGAISRPKPLNEILSDVRDVQTGALVYAASLMAIDQRKPVNRFYLQYLAARLQLSDELVESLEQRFRSSG
jgi:Protein of unknown function (DUF533)